MVGDLSGVTCSKRMMHFFGVRCPVGGCRKATQLISKKCSEEEAREAIKQHLHYSTYHHLDESEARAQADAAELDEWDEEVWDAAHAPAGGRVRLRSPTRGRSATEELVALAGGSQDMVNLEAGIIVSRQQLAGMVDALRRAKMAAETAAQLAARASRAFSEEAQVIGNCADELACYLA